LQRRPPYKRSTSAAASYTTYPGCRWIPDPY
jgi:hypothetical protein